MTLRHAEPRAEPRPEPRANPGAGRRVGTAIGTGRAALASALPLVLAFLLGLAAAGPALAQNATPEAPPDPALEPIERAVASLLAQQGEAGAFLGFAGEPDPGTTADAIAALKAAGYRGPDVDPAIAAAVAYLEDEAAAYAASGPGQAAKLALAAVAAGRDPAGFGGVDLLAEATARPVAPPTAAGAATPIPLAPGVYGTGLYDHALVLLALAAANRPAPPAAIDALRQTQQGDGAWAFDGAPAPLPGDSNTTALVIQALVATGNGDDPMVDAALDYLSSVQTPTGQFAFAVADPLVADANSTALVLQAIVAVGQQSGAADDRTAAAAGLAAFQNVGGAFRYQDAEPADNLLATLQALPALAAVPLPVAVACPATEPATVEPAPDPATVTALPIRDQIPCVEIDAAA